MTALRLLSVVALGIALGSAAVILVAAFLWDVWPGRRDKK